MSLLIDIFLFIFGCVIGSFIAAFTYREPKEISIAKGRSFCDSCGKQINWFDNIPILSFLVLRGRCRWCSKSISIRYPLIEFIIGVTFVLLGFNPISLLMFCILACVFIIDLENHLIPDQIVFIGMILELFFLILMGGDTFYSSIFAGFLASLFLLVINVATRGKGMGLGDVKFAILGGMIVGLRILAIWMIIAFLTGAIVGIILISIKRAKLRSAVAFGPFLVLSIPASLVLGEELLRIIGF